MKKKVPKFKNEDEERAFWATHDSAEYVDWKKGEKVVFRLAKSRIIKSWHEARAGKTVSLEAVRRRIEGA
jgi:hypothetical protein